MSENEEETKYISTNSEFIWFYFRYQSQNKTRRNSCNLHIKKEITGRKVRMLEPDEGYYTYKCDLIVEKIRDSLIALSKFKKYIDIKILSKWI